MSIFLKDKVQNSNGRFVLPTSGPVPHGTLVPCLIRYHLVTLFSLRPKHSFILNNDGEDRHQSGLNRKMHLLNKKLHSIFCVVCSALMKWFKRDRRQCSFVYLGFLIELVHTLKMSHAVISSSSRIFNTVPVDP